MDPYLVPLSSDQIERVKKELNVSDDVKFEHSIKLFEEWVSYQTYLPQNYDRVILRNYLRQCKHDLEKAKIKFKNYLVNLNKHSELFNDRLSCLEPEHSIYKYVYLCPLPECTPDGYRILFTKIFNTDPTVINLKRMMQTGTLIADYKIHTDDIAAGDIIVNDLEFLHGGHLPILVNTTMKKAIELALESYPMRIKAMHFLIINNPAAFRGVNIFKSLMKDSLKKKIFVHQNIESLSQYVPLRCLPSDYGGNQKSLNDLTLEVTKLLQSKKDIFEKIDSLKLSGMIPKEVDTISSLDFGVEGSFRRLEVD